MNTIALNLLNTFDTLPAPEQSELAAEILRRTLRDDLDDEEDSDLLIHAQEVALAQEIELNSIE
ncbi:hypothetical protein [Lyngbya confervoides]|uniref:CopG family transcriptional regulator n=1 Tax=Lyngbya confervoides BDU141951 TaxID=1574623 RepID=A0ABD4T9D5_9CYAN|nr:hypothetical protein [Lyngbya confervoides]MCM1985226.1 hypothetical protein [Lyngbya confervoides BDU141951]